MSAPAGATLRELHSARLNADRLRAEWQLLIHEQMVTPGDALTEAARPEAKPLLKLTLRQLLLAQPGWGSTRVKGVIDKILSVADAKIDPRQATVGWLLDPRSGGRRYAAWLDAFEPRSALGGPGFPYARRSSHGSAGIACASARGGGHV